MSAMSSNGHHWSKFWWQDWAGDPALRACSLAARGLWMALLCVMHEATPRGYLLINDQPPTAKQLAAITGATLKELATLLAELRQARVYSIDPEGWIYSRRMVKDTIASQKGYETGKRGGNPQLLQKTNGKDTTDPPHPPEGLTPPVNPNPYPHPLTQPLRGGVNRQETEVQAETEPVQEERSKLLKNLSFSGTAARAERRPDALEAALAEAGVTPPEPKPVGAEVVQMEIRRTKKALEMRIPYGEVRSVEAQLDALKEQPAAVGSDASMGLRWRPAEPIRTPAQQYAILTGCPLEEAEAKFGNALAHA
jgi:hypothetical protein